MTQNREQVYSPASVLTTVPVWYSAQSELCSYHCFVFDSRNFECTNSNYPDIRKCSVRNKRYIYNMLQNAVGGLSNGIAESLPCRWPGIICRHDSKFLLRKQYHCLYTAGELPSGTLTAAQSPAQVIVYGCEQWRNYASCYVVYCQVVTIEGVVPPLFAAIYI